MGTGRSCSCLFGTIATLFSTLLLTLATGLLWLFGFITSVRLMIPYALATGVVLLIFLAVVLAKCRAIRCIGDGPAESCHGSSITCKCISCYAGMGFIGAAVFIAASICILATVLSPAINPVLTFITAGSFWLLFFSFFATLFCFLRRC